MVELAPISTLSWTMTRPSWGILRFDRPRSSQPKPSQPTRAPGDVLGLLRISLAAILFARYGQEVAMFAVDDLAEAILGAAFFTLVALMLAGWRARVTVALTAILLTIMYFHFGSQIGRMGWDHHHTYLLMVSVIILAFAPCGNSFSLDRYLEVRRAQAAGQAPPPERGSLWAVKLFGLQLSTI